MFCLDKAKLTSKLIGTTNDNHVMALDIKAIPCASKAANDGGLVCNTDKHEAIKYLDDSRLVMYYNLGEFRP